MKTEYTVLLIEDDKRLSDVISKGLRKKDFLVEIAYDGEIGYRLSRNPAIDVILLDINIPNINGFDLASIIRKEKNNTPIIFISALGEIDDKLEAFHRGGNDYICKPFDFRELVARIEAQIKRNYLEFRKNNSEIEIADLYIDTEKKLVKRNSKIIELTAKEYFLLVYLARNEGRVISKNELMENVWGLNFDTGTNIIEVYVNYVRNKIDKNFDSKLIHTKPGLGYLLKKE